MKPGLYWDPESLLGHYLLKVDRVDGRAATVKKLPIGRAPVPGESDHFRIAVGRGSKWVMLKEYDDQPESAGGAR